MRILQASDAKEIQRVMQEIKVDPYGIKIMLPKACDYLVRINALPSISANILKQEMLSLGGDVAVGRGALTGKLKKTDCLLMGNLSQFLRLREKLAWQPFGLKEVASGLSEVISNYEKNRFVIPLNGHGSIWAKKGKALICGIVNLTPDSFSQDGLYRFPHGKYHISSVIDHVEKLALDGADVIDVGGESTRPGALPVPLKEEIERTIPVIKILAKRIKIPLSIDTYKPEVAKRALDNGASLVNDITGLKDPKMLKVASQYKCAVVLMHCKGSPRTMQKNPYYLSLMDEITTYFQKAIQRAEAAGIRKDKIIIDPGIGFAKTADHNFEILKNLAELKIFGKPILIGPSRKSFIGKITKADVKSRLPGTIASCILAVRNGASFVRVHDVKEIKQALTVTGAIEQS